MSRKGWRTYYRRRGHIEWKERKRRTYWIDQRVPTTLLPYLLLFHLLVHSFPNSPIEKKEISNDRTRPMKADQGFYSLAKRLYYRSESDVPYWPAEEHPSKKRMNGKQARSILLELSLLHPHVLLYSTIWIPSLSFPFSACWDLFPLDYSWMEVSFPKSQIMSFIESP